MSIAGSKNADVPIGVVLPYGGFIAPKGGLWLLCDGSVFDPVEYSVLYGVIGTGFGGSASAPLLPNLLGKYAKGYQAGVNSVGQSTLPTLSGTETFTLVESNIPTLNLVSSPEFTITMNQTIYTQQLLAQTVSTTPSDNNHEVIEYETTAQKIVYTTTTAGAEIEYTNATPSPVVSVINATSVAYAGYDMTYIIKAKGL